MFYKKAVFKNFAIFTGKRLYWSLFLIKLQAVACIFIKTRPLHRCFSVSIAKFLRTPILKNIYEQLLLTTSMVIWLLSFLFQRTQLLCLEILYDDFHSFIRSIKIQYAKKSTVKLNHLQMLYRTAVLKKIEKFTEK